MEIVSIMLYVKFFHAGENIAAIPYEPQTIDIKTNNGKLSGRFLTTNDL